MTNLQRNALARLPLTEEELAAIEARVEAATPGDWALVYNPQIPGVGAEVYAVHAGKKVADRGPEKPRRKKSMTFDEAAALPAGYAGLEVADARFIAHARQDVPDLVALVRRQATLLAEAEAEIARLRAQLADAPADY